MDERDIESSFNCFVFKEKNRGHKLVVYFNKSLMVRQWQKSH